MFNVVAVLSGKLIKLIFYLMPRRYVIHEAVTKGNEEHVSCVIPKMNYSSNSCEPSLLAQFSIV